MPSITFKLSDITPAKTAARKNFDGFKNKEGYQALAQGVGDAASRLKEIVIERQKAQNTIDKAEFDIVKKASAENFIKKQLEEVEKQGFVLTEEMVQQMTAKMHEQVSKDVEPYIASARGGFKEELIAARDFSVKEGEIQARLKLREVIDSQNEQRVSWYLDPLIEAGDWEAVKKKLDEFLANKTISPAQRLSIEGTLFQRQAELRAKRDCAEKPGLYLEGLDRKDARYENLSAPQREKFAKQAQDAVDADLAALTKSLSRADMGLEDRAKAIAAARLRGSINDNQAAALARRDMAAFASEYALRSKRPLRLLTAQEQEEVKGGNVAVFEKFKDGGEIIARLVVADKDDPHYKEMETQSRLLLAASGMPSAKVESALANVIGTQKKNPDAVENSLSFQARAERLANLTFREAAPEARVKSVALYQEALARFQEGLHDAQKGGKFLREGQIEEIFLAALDRVGIKPKNTHEKEDNTPKKELVLNNQ